MNQKQILVVDDDKFILTFLEHTLKKFEPDSNITTVISGTEALEKVQRSRFDLVITDYLMPGISGIDLANAIRYMTPGTAVVLMTAYANDQLHHTLELMNVDGYIRKPLNLAQVRKVITKIIGFTDKKKNRSSRLGTD
jgi:CheY-like chemotaxis protein